MNKPDSIKKLAENMFNAMNTGDFSAFENEITPDIAFDFPGVGRTEGSRRTLLLLKALLRKYPNLQFNITDNIAESDRACYELNLEHCRGCPRLLPGRTLSKK